MKPFSTSMTAAICLMSLSLTLSACAEELKYTVSWVGNSFSGKDAWVLQDVEDICVQPDGTLFTNVFWDEAGGNVQQYQNGKLMQIAGHTHGWGYEGGGAIAANSRYVFIAQAVNNEGGGLKGNSWPLKGLKWSGVSRRMRTDIRQPAPFAQGRGREGAVLQGAFLPIVTVPEGKSIEGKTGDLRGLCASEKELFVSSPFDDTIKVYDADSMRLLRAWSVPRPDKICLDAQGNLWALLRPQLQNEQRQTTGGQKQAQTESWQAQRFAPDGKRLPQRITFAAGMLPTALCVGSKNCLLVADAGSDQQIKIYADADTDPKEISAFGTKGGIFANPAGEFGNQRFHRPRGIGMDAAGNFYVASSGSVGGGSTVLESYAPEGSLNWRRFGLTFVDGADADSNAPDEIYTKEEHFTLHHPTGGHSIGMAASGAENGESDIGWKYRGYTVNPYKYPDDPRLHLEACTAWVRVINNAKLLFVTGMTADQLSVYRFAPASNGETAIPCVLFAKQHIRKKDGYPAGQPPGGEWMWRDHNGDGRMDAGEFAANIGAESKGILWPDAQGTIWQVNDKTIRGLPLQKLDKSGIPLWDYAQARNYPVPTEFDEVRRVRYLPDKDLMLLGGNQGDDHNQHWKPMGPVLSAYDNWKSSKPRLRKRIVLPYDKGSSGHESAEPISFDVAGDYVFVAYTRGLKVDGIKNAFVKILRLSDLAVVGNLSAQAQLGETGLLDLVESVSATRRPDGQYQILLEDDYKSKVIVFHWQP